MFHIIKSTIYYSLVHQQIVLSIYYFDDFFAIEICPVKFLNIIFNLSRWIGAVPIAFKEDTQTYRHCPPSRFDQNRMAFNEF